MYSQPVSAALNVLVQTKVKNVMFGVSLYPVGSNDARAVGSDEPGLALSDEGVLDLDHVDLGDALGDADDQRHLILHGLHDGGTGKWWRHVDDAGIRLHLVTGLRIRIGTEGKC